MNCPNTSPRLKPNLKNKDFVRWQRAEKIICNDNIVSTDWHEKLEKTPLFTTVDNGNPTNMIYIMSGEYGRMWLKERDEWYANVFVPSFKEINFINRRKKIRREARKAKKEAEANIKERKERRAKELEAKAKVEQEKLEKLKAKIQKFKFTEKKKSKKDGGKDVKDGVKGNKNSKTVKTTGTPSKNQKQNQETSSSRSPSQNPKEEEKTAEEGKFSCPKNSVPIELTVQCECSHHSKQEQECGGNQDDNNNNNNNNNNCMQTEKGDKNPPLCKDYMSQLAAIQDEKINSETK
ncbi:conserved hypothetical protein [Pediculus humanus corporis]|uniref:Uncharacterized protein n=1 Tax=Pediculus humanus subsp. corporis TaxID=121224 RepID=E0VVD8_PEDHC|nr:uncharacterized protein Phum_PHUM462220 [Pediculus humanus corporis]EEB17344.1 conserved hypothetical protein [Pediculus humanus corporis]